MLSATSRIAAVVLAAALVIACSSAESRDARGGGSTAGGAVPAAAAATPASAPRAMPTDSISERADSGRIQGDPRAPLWFIEASDFQCPFCKTWHDSTYPLVVRDYVKTGKIRLAYYNFPLRQHQNAMPAAEAAMCASVQGKFWPMHDLLFSTQQHWETLPNPAAKFDSLAGSIGVNLPAFRDCVAKHLTRPLIEADYSRAQAAGVGSTPTFFVGDQSVAGLEPYPLFREVIDGQLAKKGVARTPAR